MTKRKLGGKGLNALFGENTSADLYFECDISLIVPNRDQPRDFFNDSDLQDLSRSIKEQGVIQPLVVVPGDSDKYRLIAGERRLRAARLAGLKKVPVVVSNQSSDDSLLSIALVENIQRTDLNAIEEAKAYKKLVERYGYTQQQISQKIGKKRSTVSNLLRLLKLPENIQQDIINGKYSEGHGRVLVRFVSDQLKLEKLRSEIIRGDLSVRQTERFASKLEETGKKESKKKAKIVVIAKSYTKSLEEKLAGKFHSKVSIAQRAGGKGKIQIGFQSPDELERIVAILFSEKE